MGQLNNFVPGRFHCRSNIDTRNPGPTTWTLSLRSIFSTMSTVVLQAARATPTLRPRVKTKSRAIRSARCARRQVSCAASTAEAIKDKRIPVTILTGFLG